jgi:hypothetical protein
MYNNKRSKEATERREQKQSLKRQAHSFVLDHSFKDRVGNGEVINLSTPQDVIEFLNLNNELPQLKAISPCIYGSVVDVKEGFLVQAPQGLVLENGVKY